jgi:hypothetical protein
MQAAQQVPRIEGDFADLTASQRQLANHLLAVAVILAGISRKQDSCLSQAIPKRLHRCASSVLARTHDEYIHNCIKSRHDRLREIGPIDAVDAWKKQYGSPHILKRLGTAVRPVSGRKTRHRD